MTIIELKSWSYAEDLIKKRRAYRMTEDISIEANVREIINTVKGEGDQAVTNLTQKFDGVDLRVKGIKVSKKHLVDAYNKVRNEEIHALESLKNSIEKVERYKLERMSYILRDKGLEINHTVRPIESVGCYVPGGEAVYPSTLLMTVTPAKVAGVPRIVVCSPPTCEGEIDPLILVAASLCGVDEIYRVGGAQAIAALAYGTCSIRPVVKIVGPGNRFVTSAKVIVSKDVAIDIPAGPSEILIIADGTANPRLIALDLISQSEHASDNISGLVTTSKELAKNVIKEVESMVPTIDRAKVVETALSKNGFILHYHKMTEAVAFANAFASEHLEIITRKAAEVAKKITSAGIIYLGKYTPVSAGDYCFGTNHVLPTTGFSRIYSELSIIDYLKRINIVKCSKERLKSVKTVADVLARCEGLPNHSAAIEERFLNA